MQPIQRHASLRSTAEGESIDNRALRSMRSLGSIIRNARREPTSPTKAISLVRYISPWENDRHHIDAYYTGLWR